MSTSMFLAGNVVIYLCNFTEVGRIVGKFEDEDRKSVV